MIHYCKECKDYTEHKTLKYYDSYRDKGNGHLADLRKIECTVCKSQKEVDFAPDRR